MENLLKSKKIIIGGVIAVLLVVLYFGFFSGSGSVSSTETAGGVSNGSDMLVEVPVNPEEELLGRSLLLSLERMKTIKLDLSFFSDPVFKSLRDFSVEIAKQEIGRRNPFAPLIRGIRIGTTTR